MPFFWGATKPTVYQLSPTIANWSSLCGGPLNKKMTITLTGSWQAITPRAGTRSAVIQNPTGNASCYVTQRILADGVDETDAEDDPGLEIVAGGSLSIEASSTFWINGTAADEVTACFFR